MLLIPFYLTKTIKIFLYYYIYKQQGDKKKSGTYWTRTSDLCRVKAAL